MSLGGSIKVMSAGMMWRTFGAELAGRALLDAMEGDDEQERMLAGMSLVTAGERSIDLIEHAVRAGRSSTDALRLLADIGGHRSRTVLTELTSEPGDLGEAAARSLALLDRIDTAGDESA